MAAAAMTSGAPNATSHPPTLREGQFGAAFSKDDIGQVGHKRQNDHGIRLLGQRQERQAAAGQDQRARRGPAGRAPERDGAIQRQAQAQRRRGLGEDRARVGPRQCPQPPRQHGQHGCADAELQPPRRPVEHDPGERRHQWAEKQGELNGAHGFPEAAGG